jgi:hypothetical protein
MVDAGGDSGVDSRGNGRAWDQNIYWDRHTGRLKAADFDRGGPSYRNYASYMENIRADSSKRLSEEVWSQHKAQKLRRVLKRDNLYADKLSKKGDLTTGQILPVLAATMFLAEPARNIRAFLANKMILDLMEVGATYGGGKPALLPRNMCGVPHFSGTRRKRVERCPPRWLVRPRPLTLLRRMKQSQEPDRIGRPKSLPCYAAS